MAQWCSPYKGLHYNFCWSEYSTVQMTVQKIIALTINQEKDSQPSQADSTILRLMCFGNSKTSVASNNPFFMDCLQNAIAPHS